LGKDASYISEDAAEGFSAVAGLHFTKQGCLTFVEEK